MPSFSAEIPHGLGRDQATERLRGFTDRIRNKYKDQVSDFEESWTEDGQLSFSFKTFGFKIGGQVAVDEDKVNLTGELPFAAVAFRGKIEQEIRDQIAKALG